MKTNEANIESGETGAEKRVRTTPKLQLEVVNVPEHEYYLESANAFLGYEEQSTGRVAQFWCRPVESLIVSMAGTTFALELERSRGMPSGS